MPSVVIPLGGRVSLKADLHWRDDDQTAAGVFPDAGRVELGIAVRKTRTSSFDCISARSSPDPCPTREHESCMNPGMT